MNNNSLNSLLENNNEYKKNKNNRRNNRQRQNNRQNNFFDNESLAQDFLLNLFKLQNQIKLYHLQTNSYAQHNASDKFVEKISEIIDKVIESYQGIYGKIYLKKQKSIEINNMNDKQVIDFLLNMKIYFKDISPKLFDKKDTELFNLMDEVSETINILLYLFSLE